MSKNRPTNGNNFAQNAQIITRYCNERLIELIQFGGGAHMRLNDAGMTVIDFWPSTGKYWVKETNYGGGTIERAGERGYVPKKYEQAAKHLDEIFYATDL